MNPANSGDSSPTRVSERQAHQRESLAAALKLSRTILQAIREQTKNMSAMPPPTANPPVAESPIITTQFAAVAQTSPHRSLLRPLNRNKKRKPYNTLFPALYKKRNHASKK